MNSRVSAALTAAVLLVLGSVGCARNEGTPPPRQEANACASVSTGADPFETPGLIERVGDLTERDVHGKLQVEHLRGAEVVVRPTQGMSAPFLARVLQCHAARVQTAAADTSRDPLAVDHATVRVTEEDSSFVVAIHAEKPEDAQEIVRRAKALATR